MNRTQMLQSVLKCAVVLLLHVPRIDVLVTTIIMRAECIYSEEAKVVAAVRLLATPC
jgi:hypothetical protein